MIKRPFYKTCPDCGAHLDPCEKCDCNNVDARLFLYGDEILNPKPTPDKSDICKDPGKAAANG